MALIKTARGKQPRWGERCYLAENATLAGDVTLGDDCSVWFGAVLRADVDRITIGDRCNIQDLACIHQSGGSPAILGNDVSMGHGAVVHGATVCDGALIGMNAVVLDKAVVGPGAIIAAGAVVLEGTQVPANEIWGGIPAKRIKTCPPGTAEEYAKHYLMAKQWYE